MDNTSVRPADDIERIIDSYGNMLFRIALTTIGNASDAEDAVQETFIKYIDKNMSFESPEHEKAWLVRVLINKCRDVLRYRSRHQETDIDELSEYLSTDESENDRAKNSGIFEALMQVPEKFRTIMVLHYVEEYCVKEIARMTHLTVSTVKMRLQKGRKLLEEIYRREYM